MTTDIPTLLKHFGLKDTQSRRLVLSVLIKSKKPLTQKDIAAQIEQSGGATNLVTVYRILEKFESLGLIHKHLSSGGFILCSKPEEKGHHVMLSCEDCGIVEEHSDAHLCKHEDRIAKNAGFVPKTHLSEVIGICSSCN